MDQTRNFLSKDELLEVLTLTKMATAIHVGEDAVIQSANNAMLAIWGKDKSVIGKSLEEALPELKGQPFIGMFRQVWLEGLTLSGTDTPADLVIDGVRQTFYFDFEYQAIKKDGKTICILHTATDVTERFMNRKALEEAEINMRALQREQALNEELAASNEELVAINEKLHETQEQLSALNSELEEKVESRVIAFTESEKRFRTMAEGTNILIEVGDVTGKATYFNSAWIKHTGRPLEQLLEYGWTDLVHPDDRKIYLANFSASFKSQQAFTEEFRLINYQGEYRWMILQASPRYIGDDIFAGYISSCVDINDRKKAEIEIQRLASIMKASFEFIGLAAPDSSMLYCNPSALQKLGWTSVEGRDIIDCVYPEDRPLAIATLPQLNTNGSFSTEIRFYNEQTKEPFWLQWNAFTIKDPVSGEVLGIATVSPDITERKKYGQQLQAANEELAATNDNYKMAIGTANLGTWSANIELDLLNISERAQEIHGLSKDAHISLSESFDLIFPEDRKRIVSTIEKAMKTNTSFEEEYRILPKDGRGIRWLRSTGKSYVDSNGQSTHITGTIMDITERKDNELRKNDFIAMVSHELKTPLTSLTAIIQLAHMQLENNADPFLRTAMDKANNQTKKMTNLINGFLNISRLESGKIIIEKKPFDMTSLIIETIAEIKLLSPEHNIIVNNCAPVTINADRNKIASVLSNLLSNAMKYSAKEADIEVSCIVQQNFVEISVRDKGIGILQSDLEKLFDRFYRVENKNTQNISGFGIGLYLSAEIIAHHNGKIWVESEMGKGSTFYFKLPLE